MAELWNAEKQGDCLSNNRNTRRKKKKKKDEEDSDGDIEEEILNDAPQDPSLQQSSSYLSSFWNGAANATIGLGESTLGLFGTATTILKGEDPADVDVRSWTDQPPLQLSTDAFVAASTNESKVQDVVSSSSTTMDEDSSGTVPPNEVFDHLQLPTERNSLNSRKAEENDPVDTDAVEDFVDFDLPHVAEELIMSVSNSVGVAAVGLTSTFRGIGAALGHMVTDIITTTGDNDDDDDNDAAIDAGATCALRNSTSTKDKNSEQDWSFDENKHTELLHEDEVEPYQRKIKQPVLHQV